MTCSHVLARIDALALADWAPHELAAAARHARDCAACRTALAAALGARVYSLAAGESTLAFSSARIAGGTTGPLEMPGAEPAVLVLAAGLVLYLVGLLASLRGTARRGDP
jgi:hypothetical protein